jgi:hypothetical protein
MQLKFGKVSKKQAQALGFAIKAFRLVVETQRKRRADMLGLMQIFKT